MRLRLLLAVKEGVEGKGSEAASAMAKWFGLRLFQETLVSAYMLISVEGAATACAQVGALCWGISLAFFAKCFFVDGNMKDLSPIAVKAAMAALLGYVGFF